MYAREDADIESLYFGNSRIQRINSFAYPGLQITVDGTTSEAVTRNIWGTKQLLLMP